MTADTGIDALTHALEAAVSIFASPYTDAFCMQAVNLIFDALPRAVRRRRRPRGAHRRWPTPRRSPGWRSRTPSSASTTRSPTPSAPASASPTAAPTRIFLPHVLRYNAVAADASSCRRPGTRPTSRPEKYAQIGWVLGFGGQRPRRSAASGCSTASTSCSTAVGMPRSLAEAGVDRDGVRGRAARPRHAPPSRTPACAPTRACR